jgi:REP element-mobilizing transposase RayT
MPVRVQHDQLPQRIFFITFTCYKWLHLFEITHTYTAAYKCFDSLFTKGICVTGYVIMPNHVHALIYFPQMPKFLNTIVGNAKRFMAYEIIKQLEDKKDYKLLEILYAGVSKRERKINQRHKVFEESFDAKECYSKEFIFQKLDYIHHNPVSKKWDLVNDFADYEYSSASFYEKEIMKYAKLIHINDVLQ